MKKILILLSALMVIASCSKDEKPINIEIPEELPQLNQDSVNNLLIGRWTEIRNPDVFNGGYNELVFTKEFILDRRLVTYKDGEADRIMRRILPLPNYHFRKYVLFDDYLKLVMCPITSENPDNMSHHPIKYDPVNDILYHRPSLGDLETEGMVNLSEFVKYRRVDPDFPEPI